MKPLLVALSYAVSLYCYADDWPQWLGPNRDGTWREDGILERFPDSGPTVRWRVPIGSGFSGPAVAHGRVYITDRQLAPDAQNPANPFDRGSVAGKERVLCLDDQTGKIVCTHEYDAPYTVSYGSGPRTTPLVDNGKVYTLGAEGHLFCFEATDGKVIWSREFKKEFNIPTPLWGFDGHPLIDGDRLICLAGGTNSVAVAFDKNTGREIWRSLGAKEPGYAPPTVLELGGKRQLILWHPESVNSLDPATGNINWTFPWSLRSGLNVATPWKSGDLLFLTAFYNGSLMLRVRGDQPEVVWRSKKVSETDTDGLHSIIASPIIVGDYIYGICSYGQLRCINKETGERVWETFAATGGKSTRWANAFITPQTAHYFLFNEKGDLIIADLSSSGYTELSRAHLIDPTNRDPGREVVWSHPAYANRNVYVCNDKEIASFSLAK